jgi:exodeoxyribonuclease VII small subunit
MKKKTIGNFETNLEKLEKIVAQLERGDLPLEKSIELYKEGKDLAKDLEERLVFVEKEIRVFMERDDEEPRSMVEEEIPREVDEEESFDG